MKERLKKIKQMRILPVFLLAVIIILQLLNVTYTIVNKKKGYHSDEIFSYGLSNSFYQPFLHSDKIYVDSNEYINVDKWIPGELLRDYVTVQPDETFRYDSVWYNQMLDRHPPLYYAVLHTICSFFPDTYSPVFGYIINYVCFIVMQIFLYKLAVNMLKSKYLALLFCCFWGFTTAAVDMNIFIRMYCMLTMMTVIFMYLHSEMYRISRQPGQKPSVKMYIALITVTALGALTQHMFLIVAFLTAVFFCIYYLAKKQFRVFWKYGFSVLGGTVFSVLVFPYTINHLLSESGKISYSLFFRQLYLTYRYFLRDIVSLAGGETIFLIITLPVFLLIAVVFSIPVLYLLRDKPKVKKFLLSLKALPEKIKTAKFKAILKGLWNNIKKIHPMFYLFFICIPVIFAMTAYSVDFISMGYVERYLFIVYPLAALVFFGLLCFLFTSLKIKKIAVTVIISAIIFHSIFGHNSTFLFDQKRTMDSIDELTAGNECIFVVKDRDERWLLDTLPGAVYNADNVMMTYMTEDKDVLEEIASLKTNKKVYLFINAYTRTYEDETYLYMYDKKYINGKKKISADDYYNIFKNMPYSTMFEYIGEYSIFSRTYTIYELA